MTTKYNLQPIINLKKVFKFILNSQFNILEQSIGQYDLILFITDKIPSIIFDMYEIDTKIKILDKIQKDNVIYGDFMKKTILKLYKTIIGNHPYIRTKKETYILILQKIL